MNELHTLLAASPRRAVLGNQLEHARLRYEERIRIGFGGCVFVCSDLQIAALKAKQEVNQDWDFAIIDENGIPLLLGEESGTQLLFEMIQANVMASRSYYEEYTKLVESGFL